MYVAAADVDGDGRADIVTGAGAGGGPHVKVFSGADLSTLASFYAYAPAFAGGVTVAAGDLNGDGLADVITGPGPGGGPNVKAFQVFAYPRVAFPGGNTYYVPPVPTLATLLSFYAYDSSFLGGVNVAYAQQGTTPAIVTGAASNARPDVRLYDASLTLRAAFNAYDPSFHGGVRVGSTAGAVLTAPGPTGGPNGRSFDAASLTLFGSTYVLDANFTGGVFVS